MSKIMTEPTVQGLEPIVETVAPNPFDPETLRVTGNVDTIGAEKLLLRIPVRKPSKQEFFRVNTNPEFRLPCAILELKVEREFYLVTPNALHILAEDVRQVELLLCVNRQNGLFFWPLPMPNPDGRTLSWHESARDAAKVAEDSWIRMVANMSEGIYLIFRASAPIPDPSWPEKSMQELLELAFKDGKLVDSKDHPVVQQLYGG
jgi:hypothetical protein